MLSETPPTFLLDSEVPKCQCCHVEMGNLWIQGARLFAARLWGEQGFTPVLLSFMLFSFCHFPLGFVVTQNCLMAAWWLV